MSNILNQHGVPNAGIRMGIKNNKLAIENMDGRLTTLEELPPIIVSDVAPSENLSEGMLWRHRGTGVNKICIKQSDGKLAFEDFEFFDDVYETIEGVRVYLSTYIEEQIAMASNSLDENIGDRNILKTKFKSNMVGAVNELTDAIKDLQLTGGGNPDYDITAEIRKGESKFNSMDGVLITHNLNTLDYSVSVESTAVASGTVGEIWIGDKTANTFKVYNSGLDKTVNFLWAAMASIPRIIRGTGVFKSVTGSVIAHGANTTDYSVSIVPTSNPGGDLGDVYITNKLDNSFTVVCSGATTSATFDWILYR